jgi:hypothetical protein
MHRPLNTEAPPPLACPPLLQAAAPNPFPPPPPQTTRPTGTLKDLYAAIVRVGQLRLPEGITRPDEVMVAATLEHT